MNLLRALDDLPDDCGNKEEKFLEVTMNKTKRNRAMAGGVLGVVLLLAAPAPAQDRDDDPTFKLRTPIRLSPFGFGGGMTSVDPPSTDGKPNEDQPVPQPQPGLLKIESTGTGTIQRYSDGSTIEFKPECMTQTLCNGTKIETLPNETKIVRWPNGGGIIRYPDGTGAEFRPDPKDPSKSGDLTPAQGTIEVLPGGAVRQTLKDDGVVLDRFPNGTVRSRPDLVTPEMKAGNKPMSGTPSPSPLSRPPAMELKGNSPKPLIPTVKPSIIR
jgi:hypothetical protein